MFSVIAGLLISVALIPLGLVLPQWVPKIIPPILYAYGMQLIAERLQDTLLGDHREAGGQVGSWWKVIGICLVSMAVFLALIFLVLWVLPQRFGGLGGV